MGNIFGRKSLVEHIHKRRANLIERVDAHELNSSSDIDRIKENYKSEFQIEPLEFAKPIPSNPKESYKIIPNRRRRPTRTKVYEIPVEIPFTGNRSLLECYPPHYTPVNIERPFRIIHNSIHLSIELFEFDDQKYNDAIKYLLNTLAVNVPKLNKVVEDWNNSLDEILNQLLEKRHDEVAKKEEFMQKIGFKVNPAHDEFLMPSPIKKRRIPKPVSETSKTKEKELIPILQEEVYSDIIEVIYNVGKAIERKPSIYRDKSEEDLRDIFLLFLETRYESTSGVGEAFNHTGRTDILLKYAPDGSNIFVAECKIWAGKKGLFDAIDQLLGYLTHRDSKTSLIIFVKRKDFLPVLETTETEIKSHPNFRSQINRRYDSSISCEFALPRHLDRIINLEVQLFDFSMK